MRGLSLRRSIRFRFTMIVLSMLIMFMVLNLVLNMNFLERYYQKQKMNTAISQVEKLNEIMERYEFTGNGSQIDEAMAQEVEEVLRTCWTTYNMSFMVLGYGNEVLFHSARENDDLYERFQDLIFDQGDQIQILYENDYYRVVLSKDHRSSNSFLSGYGFLNCGYSFLISMPVESIQESAAISNRFFMYVGMLVILLAGIITFFMMKRLTRPVKELSDIASRMAKLDFEASYTGEAEDEIGELGASMNHMSLVLKQTIDELQQANAQLQRDYEQMQRVDEMRKEFLSDVSHELKTPIAIIQGYAEGLQDCVNEDEESRTFYCDVIMDEAVKMNRMVQKLLKLNQLEFSNTLLERIDFNIGEMIENMIQSFALLVSDKKGRIVYNPCQPELTVNGDAFLMEEVLQNYISNACNHLAKHGVIRITSQAMGNGMARITVYNEGKPIPEAALEQVWNRFFKVDKARTRAYGGSGIGLSIVKAIMEQHGCAYGVKNLENGVEFWFELPMVKE